MPGGSSLYKSGTGMWMWVAHRTTGVAVFFFLLIHVTDTALVRVSPEAYDQVIGLYKNPFMGLVESGLVAAIVFHALNGLRIISLDVWEWANRHQNRLAWVVWILWIIAMAGFLPRHLGHVFGGE